MNFPTALLAAAVAAVFISIVVSGVRRRKGAEAVPAAAVVPAVRERVIWKNERRAAGKGSCGGIDEWAGTVSSGRLPPGAGRARRALRRYRADAGCNASLGGKDAFLLFTKMSYRPGAIWEGVSDGHRLFAGAVLCPAAGEG